jgi:hypothetical protein
MQIRERKMIRVFFIGYKLIIKSWLPKLKGDLEY